MRLRVLLSLCLLVLLLPRDIVGGKGPHWEYKGVYGPNSWSDHYPMCAGFSQSPVNLRTDNAWQDRWNSPLTFTNFDKDDGVSWTLINNGHTALMSLASGDLRVSGGGLAGEYRVLQLHFHWGSDDSQGSEHAVNGQHFPLEMHIVTYNLAYGNVTNALKYPNGLAVLGVFFELGSSDNSKFDPLVDALSSVSQAGKRQQTFKVGQTGQKITLPLLFRVGSKLNFWIYTFSWTLTKTVGYTGKEGISTSVNTVPLRAMMPDNTDHFFRYMGSLTTPPCSEAVVWTLFKEPVVISSGQLDAFRELYMPSSGSDEENALMDNFRPLQPLNWRPVTINFSTD